MSIKILKAIYNKNLEYWCIHYGYKLREQIKKVILKRISATWLWKQ